MVVDCQPLGNRSLFLLEFDYILCFDKYTMREISRGLGFAKRYTSEIGFVVLHFILFNVTEISMYLQGL